jgi:hypothetical protein
MNKLVVSGMAVLLAAAGGGAAWWMTNQGGTPSAAVAVTEAPVSESAQAPTKASEVASAAVMTVDDAPAMAAASDAATQSISIERGPCFGPCPIYKATVYGDDRLVFEGRKFVARQGTHEARIPQGSFGRLIDIAKRHDFASMDAKWPDDKGLNCPEPPTDMPTVIVTVSAADLRHSVSYYEGCGGTRESERVERMVADLDKALALGEWIGRREDWYGKRSAPDK